MVSVDGAIVGIALVQPVNGFFGTVAFMSRSAARGASLRHPELAHCVPFEGATKVIAGSP